ncbi:hypothetical protein Cgig2_017962 [Carnegiea gigantea]|uniref:Uncharacterized protein n=1 Tax=Carnegiea gigantea TaxID=171969 RepID=A0A9Q1K8Z7_9CARY|nr:hypothetical protein Cgig2_017962 [Carnegiea gigantea]
MTWKERRAQGQTTKPPSPVIAARSEARLSMAFRTEKDKYSRERDSILPFVMAFPPFHDTVEMANYFRETFKWHLRGASHLLRPLLEYYQDLCPSFTLSDTDEAACDFDIPEIVQATFYAMVVKDAVQLSVLSRDLAGNLKSTLKGLRWTIFKSWLNVNKHALLEVQLGRRVLLGGGLGQANNQEESSGSNNHPPPSGDEKSQVPLVVRFFVTLLVLVRLCLTSVPIEPPALFRDWGCNPVLWATLAA